MKRLCILALLAATMPIAANAQLAGQYGVEQTVYLRFLDTDGTPLVGESDSGSEVTLSCDAGTPATATNDFGADTNTPGRYPLVLTAAETQCETITIDVAASVDQAFELETYGDASARHPDIGAFTVQDIADVPTNAELAAALGTADDAILAAIAALDDLSSAQAQAAAEAALAAYDPPTRAELTSDINALDALLDRVLGGTVSFSSAITGVTSQTVLVTQDDPGPDQTYVNRRVCVEDVTTGYNDCAWVNGYDTDTNTWTLSNALRFTVATSDVLRILPIERTF